MPSTTTNQATRDAERKRRRAARDAARAARRNGGPDGKPAKKEGWRETLRFWAWAILIIVLVRIFIFEPFRIPTPSMEKTLLVGDFLFVSKLHYGARTPSTLGIPFTGLYLRGLELPHTRLPGFADVERGDVAVFNYPPETGPVERRTPYIKRLVAVPGDTLRLVDKVLYVNGTRYPLTDEQMQHWRVTPAAGAAVPAARVRELGAETVGTIPNSGHLVVNATPEAAEAMRAWPYVAIVEPFSIPEGTSTGTMFPAGSGFNRDNYGPLVVPRRGQTARLTPATWPALRDIIVRFEDRRAEALPDGTFRIDGEVTDTYTFEQDYYFAMGDNRDNSQDSRFWGFVPHDHLVGKAVLVFFSIDTERWLPRLRGLKPIR